MSVTKQLRRGAVALTAIAALGLPQDGQAQSIDMTASMSATCMGDCDVVRFTLGLPAVNAYIDLARLFAASGSPWKFASLLGVQDQNLVDQGWSHTLGNSGLLLRGSGQFAAEPLHIYVQMATWGGKSQLNNGSLWFSGQGNTQINGLGTDISYGGTVGQAAVAVVPEPASLLLLGTGLAGVVGAARRRRRGEDV